MSSTMERVASAANGSVATVSRVLNAPARVAPATQERVRAAMRQIGYSYNTVAGSLSRQRTMTLGLIVPALTKPIFAGPTCAVQQCAAPRGYALRIGTTDYRADEEARLARGATTLLAEATYPTSVGPDLIAHGHLTAGQAGELARRTGAQQPSCLTWPARPRQRGAG